VLSTTDKMLARWEQLPETGAGDPGREVEMHSQLTAITLDIIGQVGFGQDFNCLENPDCYFAKAGNVLSLEAVTRFYQPRWMWGLDRKRAREFTEAMAYYTDLVRDVIKQQGGSGAGGAGEAGGGGGDALPNMMAVMAGAADAETGKRLSEKELLDQVYRVPQPLTFSAHRAQAAACVPEGKFPLVGTPSVLALPLPPAAPPADREPGAGWLDCLCT
jgi:cytochrome P450